MTCNKCKFNKKTILNTVYCDWLETYVENIGCHRNIKLCSSCKHKHTDIDGRYVYCDDEVIDTEEIDNCNKYRLTKV